MYTEGQLPRHTATTAYYGEEQEYTSSMDLAGKILIDLLFPDELIQDFGHLTSISAKSGSLDMAVFVHCSTRLIDLK